MLKWRPFSLRRVTDSSERKIREKAKLRTFCEFKKKNVEFDYFEFRRDWNSTAAINFWMVWSLLANISLQLQWIFIPFEFGPKQQKKRNIRDDFFSLSFVRRIFLFVKLKMFKFSAFSWRFVLSFFSFSVDGKKERINSNANWKTWIGECCPILSHEFLHIRSTFCVKRQMTFLLNFHSNEAELILLLLLIALDRKEPTKSTKCAQSEKGWKLSWPDQTSFVICAAQAKTRGTTSEASKEVTLTLTLGLICLSLVA